jgi:hypothetical protein
MSVRMITAQLQDVRNRLRQGVTAKTNAAEAALTDAARLTNSVLDEVQNKSLAQSMTAHAQAVKDSAKLIEGIDRELAATIARFQSIGGR